LRNAAVKSVEVSGLDFGAVDCAISADSLPFIIEINSGPGLQGTALQKYIDAFAEKINAIENPQPNVAKRAAKSVAGAAKKAVGADNAVPRKASAAAKGVGMARLMQNVRSDDEARAVIEALMADKG